MIFENLDGQDNSVLIRIMSDRKDFAISEIL
jgi:hypothetical protein